MGIVKTNKGLCEYAIAQIGQPYWYGTFGQTATKALYDDKKKQYPKYYNPWNNFPLQYGKRVHDCVGLIKGYLWSETPTSAPKYDGSQDVSANLMREKCVEKGDIGTMPDIEGILVFMNGHVGVYIGGGYVVEAMGHDEGVVKTKFAGRGWKWWGKCPWIEYEENTDKILYTVQLGAFLVKKNAENSLKIARKTFPEAFIKTIGNTHFLQIGAFAVYENAEKLLAEARKTFSDAFIKPLR